VIFLIILGALSVISFILVVAASMLSSRLSRLERQLHVNHRSDETWPAADSAEIHGPSRSGSAEYGPAESERVESPA
jgi:hypothetical protein